MNTREELLNPPEGTGNDGAADAQGANAEAQDEAKETAPVMPQQQAEPQQQSAPSGGTGTRLALGRGLDVGTANLMAAAQTVEGEVSINLQRNAFIDIEPEEHTRNMLNQLAVPFIEINNHMVVVGDHAFKLANVFNRETRRPMKDGMISPGEADAMPIEKLLLEHLLGRPTQQGETCYFSVPADPIDAETLTLICTLPKFP